MRPSYTDRFEILGTIYIYICTETICYHVTISIEWRVENQSAV